MNEEQLQTHSEEAYSVVCLGGIREIGKNMWLVSNGEHMVMIDAGLKFPSEDMYGVNHLLPDMTYVLQNEEKLVGIILTHAHEDHVGALTTLLESLENPPPIYGSELTVGLLEARVKEVDEAYVSLMTSIEGRQRIQMGSMEVEFLHVCHSISGALGLAIHTPDGAIVFTGDFKMDPTPIDQQPTDYFRFASLGEEGVLLLVSDSTNATQKGHTISEKDVAEGFRNAFYRAKGRIIIATFASSLHRIQQIINRCEEFDRRVAFIGRSMERMTARAKEMGYLNYPEHLSLTAEEVDNYPPEKVAIVTTGSQGEPSAALSRMAAGRYHPITIGEGDTVVISATPIPGNERSIYRNVNKLYERGAEVVYGSGHGLHASGHASQEELKLMLNLTRPRYFVPTHGEYRQMYAHAGLAKATGVPEEHIFMLDLGQRLSLSAESAAVVEEVTAGEVMVSGRGDGYLDPKELKERHRLVRHGVLMASVSVDPKGHCLSTPRLISKGFVIDDEPTELYDEAAEALMQALDKQLDKWHKNERVPELKDLENWISDHLSRIIQQKTRRRPMIIPLVNQLVDADEGPHDSEQADAFSDEPLAEVFEQLLQDYRAGELNPDKIRLEEVVTPPHADDILDTQALESERRSELAELGQQIIDGGHVGAIVLAGGMATRFAFDAPKALFPIVGDTSFLEIKVRSLCGQGLPMYLMTSFHTHDAIVEFLKAHDYFGFEEQIQVFQQFRLPRIYADGSLRQVDGAVDYATAGHGDFVEALKQSGCLKEFLTQGGRYLFFSNIDNLGASLDPVLVGLHAEAGVDMSIEVAAKAPGDKGGAPARVADRLQLVEGFLFPADFDQDRIEVFNTATYIFSASALKAEFELPWYVVKKQVDGEEVLQFEHLAGDLSRDLSLQCLLTPREERFLPVKQQTDVSSVEPLIRAKYSSLFDA